MLCEVSGAAVHLSGITGTYARILDGQRGNGAYPTIFPAEDVQSFQTCGITWRSGSRSIAYYTQLEPAIKNFCSNVHPGVSDFPVLVTGKKSTGIGIDQTLVSLCLICLALARSWFKQTAGVGP